MQFFEEYPKKAPGISIEMVNRIGQNFGLTFIPEKEPEGNVCYLNNPEVRDDYKTTFAPIDLLNYIYAVLHAPVYRKKYKDFLKFDFQQVPYSTDAGIFWQLVDQGSRLLAGKMFEPTGKNKFTAAFPKEGDNVVTRKMTAGSPGWKPTNAGKMKGCVWINDTQYFDGVPRVAWEFYTGGYQPAQKWLKNRYGRLLGFNDIRHYRNMIVTLAETHRLMHKIDKTKNADS